MKLPEIDIYKVGNTIQMSGVVYSGEGKHFLCMYPEEQTEPSIELTRLDMDHDDWKRFIKQTDHLEVEILERLPDSKDLVKAVIRKSTRHIEQGVSWRVFKRDNYSCRYCGANDTPLTVDHLVLWEEGGPSIEANLVSACRKCNKTRGNMQYDEWLRSPYYLKVSRPITSVGRFANVALVGTLDDIPRRVQVRNR